MERNNDIIKLDQQIARISAEIKQLDLDKLEVTRQIHTAEQELPRLKSELDAAHRNAETKIRELEHHQGPTLHKSIFKEIIPTNAPQKDDFYIMSKKGEIERELEQKMRENERATIEAKQKVSVLQKKMYDIDRRHFEHDAEKRNIEREKEAILQKIELTKRAEAADDARKKKAQQPSHFKHATGAAPLIPIQEEKTQPSDE